MENNYQLSIIIPSRNEMFLKNTVEDILRNKEGETEVIVVLDGNWSNPPLDQHPDVKVIHLAQSIGQRAATNLACKLSKSKYIMKIDAHCAFDKGFDVKMIAGMRDDWTMAPIMKNLHAFDWVCPDGHRRYQGPSGNCLSVFKDGKWVEMARDNKEREKYQCCDKPTIRDVVWQPKKSPNSISYRFDKTLHFQYFGEFSKRPEGQGEFPPSMSLQGSCFMCTRERYNTLNLCNETWGSWGNQGTEVACKTWLSGGEVRINKNTWYAHMFRTQGGDFSFPYHNPNNEIEHARQQSREAFLESKWDKAIHPLSWLIEKFAPVPDWDTIPERAKTIHAGPSKGIIFYTDNELDPKIANKVKEQLATIGKEKSIRIVSSSLKKMAFGDKDIHFPSLKRGYLTMAKQILAALENSSADIIFFCEHDVLYHPSHFDFTPPEKDKFYYNQNFWRLKLFDGHVVHWDASQLSGLCAYRTLVLEEYKKIVAFIEQNGFSMRTVSFEPGSRDGRSVAWKSESPNVDIRHGGNLTMEKWGINDFRDKSTCVNWQEGDNWQVPGWNNLKELLRG